MLQIRNLFHCVAESWWNMPFKGTRHGNGVTDGAVAKLLRLWQHASALWRHAVWIRIVTSHNAWMGYEYWLPNMNRPRAIHKHDRTPSKQWGVCDKRRKGMESNLNYQMDTNSCMSRWIGGIGVFNIICQSHWHKRQTSSLDLVNGLSRKIQLHKVLKILRWL